MDAASVADEAEAAAAEDDVDEAEPRGGGHRKGERSNCHCHSQRFLLLLST